MATQSFDVSSQNPGVSGGGDSGGSPHIADLSYRNYDGPLQNRLARWWIVSVATFRTNLNRKRLGYWIPAILIVFIYLVMGAIFYFGQTFRQRIGMGDASINYYAITLYQGLTGTAILLFSAALTIGAASIAADNRANALLVYLSKPLTRIDYLLGKWMGIFLLLVALTLIPSLCMYVFFLTAYYNDGFLKGNETLIWKLILAALVPAALHTSLILGFSAWSKNPRTAGAVYAAFYFITNIFAGLGSNLILSRDKAGTQVTTAALVSSLSVEGVVRGVGMHLYDITPSQIVQQFTGGRRRRRRNPENTDQNTPAFARAERPPLVPLLAVGAAMLIIPLFAASARVRAVEVIKG